MLDADLSDADLSDADLSDADFFEEYGTGIYHSSTRLYLLVLRYPLKNWMIQALKEHTQRQIAISKQETLSNGRK